MKVARRPPLADVDMTTKGGNPRVHATQVALLLFLCFGVVPSGMLSACGAEGRPGPEVDSPNFESAHCPSTDEALTQTQRALERPELRAMRPHLGEILMRGGGLRLAVPLIAATAREVNTADLATLIDGYADGRGLARISPHLRALLVHLVADIDSAPERTRDATRAAWQILTRCDSVATLRSFAQIAALEVGEGETRESWLYRVLQSVALLEEHPQFQEWVSRLRLAVEGNEPADEAAGREAVLRLARLLAANLASPDFDPTYLRGVLEDFLLSQENQPQELRQELIRLVDLLLVLAQPNLDILPAVQGVAACVTDMDADAALVGLVFDSVLEGDVDVRRMANDLRDLMDEEEGKAALHLVAGMDRAIQSEPRLAKDFIVKSAAFISPDVYDETLPALGALAGSGVVGELVQVVGRWLYGCAEENP